MEEEKKPAEELTNTEQAEELTNTEITQEQFNKFAESKGFKVFDNESFNTLQSNLLKEGAQKAYPQHYGKGLDKAKIELAKKFNLELQDDSKFEDVLNSVNISKSNDNDIELLRSKLIETESNYQKQLEEMQSRFQSKELESIFNSVWSNIVTKIEGTEENIAKHKRLAFLDVQNSLDFSGDVVKNGDYEYKDELRNAIPKNKALEQFLLNTLPLKPNKPAVSGNGMQPTTNGQSFNNINNFSELITTIQNKGIDINSKEALKIQTDWYASKLKK